MNCAQCQERLVAYLEGLLKDSAKQAVAEHLKECETCRTEFQGLQTLQQRLVDSGRALAHSDLEDHVMNRIIREQNARLKSAAQAGTGHVAQPPAAVEFEGPSPGAGRVPKRESIAFGVPMPRGIQRITPEGGGAIRRLIMKSSIVKVAVAAVIVLAVTGGLSLWTGTESSVALADVLSKVEQVQAFMYKMSMQVKGEMPGMGKMDTAVEVSALVAGDYGMRMDMTSTTTVPAAQTVTQQMYMLPQQNTILVLLPGFKQYMRMQVDEKMLEQKRQENNDPRLMLKKILECQYTDLGKTTLDGIEVQGFQTTDPAYGGGIGDVDIKVWVNRKTEMPVRVDMKFHMNEQMEMEGTMHDFQWDVPVSAAEFNPVIPADYTAAATDGMKVPPMTEETALAGLKLCLELNDKYPDDLNLMTLIQMASKSFRDDFAPDAATVRPPDGTAATPEEAKQKLTAQVQDGVKKAMDKMMPIQGLGGFYMTLVQGKKEPVYYGKVVTPGDVAQVLLRWKTGPNEYRVIFADLHADTVDADTLATLEAAMPK